ncbi:hypothetical protein CEQ21_00385 [Niallia circulans]|uniref:Uncharacterized protein n=1 Tax=Niallia circulans TaxID=1397 RepID=A0A553SR61_NIACI|nr:hypothetical protein [Niallia circulans]TRZ39470.1 hypothetical protein CEQ21_00385 [Niallia circulans]
MFIFIFLIRYISEQPLLNVGTLLVSICGIILSCNGLNYNKSGIVQLSRIVLCFMIPIENFLMYLNNFVGNASDGFEFIPFSIGEKLRIACQILFIFLPEIAWIVSKNINIQPARWLPFLYPFGIIVFHKFLPF